MPIEIRELVIRARVNPGDEQPPTVAAQGTREPPRNEELTQTCVREVLRVLEDRRER
jgi:hypothetical protein